MLAGTSAWITRFQILADSSWRDSNTYFRDNSSAILPSPMLGFSRAIRRTNPRRSFGSGGLTEKVVWYVVKYFGKTPGIEKVAPHDLHRTCAACATSREENSSKSSFC